MAHKNWKKPAGAYLLLLAVILAGCAKKEDNTEGTITGTEGLEISFVENFPQEKYVISPEETQSFTVVVDIKNKGAYSLEAELKENPEYKKEAEPFNNAIILYTGEIAIWEEKIKKEMVKEKPDATVIATLKSELQAKKTKLRENEDALSALKKKIPKDENDPLKNAKLFIGGFDKGIIPMGVTSETLYDKLLPAASPLNPDGGFDSVTFNGEIVADNLKVNRYEPMVLATACYPYTTKAGPNVCIDPNPFDTKQEKVCSLGSQTLTSQGAPVAVIKIDEEASSKKLRFKIAIKNAGTGDVISLSSLDKCSSQTNLLKREDFDLVELSSVKAGTIELLDNCGPFAKKDTHLIRLFEGEGFVVCTIGIGDTEEDTKGLGSTSAYLTPLSIELKYGYRNTVLKQVSIRKLE